MAKKITRRDFLMGSVASLASVGVLCACGTDAGATTEASTTAGTTAAPATEAPTKGAAQENAGQQWDAEYDVVVLGYGGAGANAAVAAYENGAKVLLSEKAPAGLEGGNTQASGQFVMATDDPDQLYTYLTTLMGKFNNWDHEAVRAYCDGCAENFDWMTKTLGGDPEVICPVEHPGGMEANMPGWKEWENPWGLGRKGYVYTWDEFPEYPSSAHCLCLTASGTRFDRSYYNLCQKAIQDRPDIDVWSGAPGKKLIADENGAVIGVIIEKDGKALRVKANGGVVLATGGFEHNKEMIASFLQQPYVHQQGGLYNDGDGIKMAMAVGADLWHMSNSAGFTWTYKRPNLSTVSIMSGPNSRCGVYVGLGGSRFMDETAAARHGRIDIGGRWISTPMPLPAYVVQDAESLAAGNKLVTGFSDGYVDELASGEVLTGETLEELAEAIRKSNDGKDAPDFNTEVFTASIAAYNKRYDAGEDADFGRPFSTMLPVRTGPFYAAKIGPTYFNTMGGPRRNKFGQVIDTDGLAIEGLFSAGELGSIFCDMYNGSGNLGETMVFGRISGTNAALRAQGKFTSETVPVTIWQGEDDEDGNVTIVTGTYKDGTYEGTGKGFNGDINVSVTITDGKISDVQVVSHSETENIGGSALPDYCKQTVDTQGLELDVVSSASNTLRGYKDAVNDALTKAVQ